MKDLIERVLQETYAQRFAAVAREIGVKPPPQAKPSKSSVMSQDELIDFLRNPRYKDEGITIQDLTMFRGPAVATEYRRVMRNMIKAGILTVTKERRGYPATMKNVYRLTPRWQ